MRYWCLHDAVFKELEFLILQDLLDLEDETKSDEEEEEEEVNCLKRSVTISIKLCACITIMSKTNHTQICFH